MLTSAQTVNSAYPSPEALFQGPDAKLRDACECLAIPSTDISTRTVTYTPTTTTTTCPTPAPCHIEGLQWAYYHFGEGDVIPVDTNGSDYNIDVSALKHTQPNVTGTTVYVNVNSTDASTPIDIYGHQEIPDFFALNHRGYLYANITGTYAVTLVNTDDVSYFWYNETAYEGWNITDADMYNNYDDAESAHIDLVAGDYLPIRLIYANAQGAASLSFTITAPDGSEILGPNSTASPYIVQYSCDMMTAPEFPPFGQEL